MGEKQTDGSLRKLRDGLTELQKPEMAQLMSIRLSRFDASPWGFRLQGGKDFGQPLIIQKVNANSPAEKAGLLPGDSLIKINNAELFNMTHKDAQNAIVRAGNNFELTIQRGGSTWKPSVVPVGPTPTINQSGHIQPVTKTSLAHKPQAPAPSFNQYNYAPKPFGGAQVNGETVKSLASKQYNSPIGLYSDQTIAETLSAQAEVLAGGVVGVNFKKNEKTYNAANSEVLKMVQEIDKEPREPEPAEVTPTTPIATTPKASNVPVSNPLSGLRHVSAPETKVSQPAQDPFKVLPPGQNICADCERLIVIPQPQIRHSTSSSLSYYSTASHAVGGRAVSPRLVTPLATQLPPQNHSLPSSPQPVSSETPKCSDCERFIIGLFVRIKDKNLHVECFKCSTCGTSLKNVGYYNINNKLYCDVHAKMVARQNPPAPNLEPVTVSPGSKLPSSIISSSIGAAPSYQSQFSSSSTGLGSPQPGTIAPLPFHAPQSSVKHVSAPRSYFTPNKSPSSTQPPKTNFTQPAASSPLATRPQSAETDKEDPCEVTEKMANLSMNYDNLPKCWMCNKRGPFITALGKIWCPDHFVCTNAQCRRPLADIGFVEEGHQLYCEFCFEKYIAPTCDKCNNKIKGDCLNAIGKHFHPECFSCSYCGKLFGNNPFFMEEGLPYCQADWNELFTTKCFACGFPIEAGDRWVEALNNNYHSQCFNCAACKTNLEGQTFYAKGGRPFCKAHAR